MSRRMNPHMSTAVHLFRTVIPRLLGMEVRQMR